MEIFYQDIIDGEAFPHNLGEYRLILKVIQGQKIPI